MHPLSAEKDNAKAVVLMSGGIDSTILAYTLKTLKFYDKVIGTFFNYGQPNLEPTLKAARYYAKLYNISLNVIEVPHNIMYAPPEFKEGVTDKTLYQNQAELKLKSWVSARNAIFMLIAGRWAVDSECDKVFVSFQMDYPEWMKYLHLVDKTQFAATDITPAFVGQMNMMAGYCFKRPLVYMAPYLDLMFSRSEIFSIANHYQMDLSKTYSCRYGPTECGECEQCVIRKKNLVEYKNNIDNEAVKKYIRYFQ